MNESKTISIFEVQSGKIVEEEYYIVEQSGKKGLYDISEPKHEVLPCAYESLDSCSNWDPDDGPTPGIIIKKDGLYGYFCNRSIIIQCEFERIEVGAWNVKYMELRIEHEGLKGLIVVDFSNNTAHTRIPITYREIRYGATLIACQSKDVWSIYSRPIKTNGDSCDYFMKGEFKTITTQYHEPYPVQNNMILLPDSVLSFWWEVDKIEEIVESHHYLDNVIRTIITKDGKFGLWDNIRWRFILNIKYDQLIPIKEWENGDNEDCSLYMLAENGKAGVYDIKYSCFVLNPIYDYLSYLEESKTFLTTINKKKGVLSSRGNVLISHLYDSISVLSMTLIKDDGNIDNSYQTSILYTAAIDGKLDLYSEYGKLLFNKRYDKIEIEKTTFHHTDSIWYNMEESLLVKVYEGKLVGLFIETDSGLSSVFACEYDSIVYVPEIDVFITKQKNEIKHLTYSALYLDLLRRKG